MYGSIGIFGTRQWNTSDFNEAFSLAPLENQKRVTEYRIKGIEYPWQICPSLRTDNSYSFIYELYT